MKNSIYFPFLNFRFLTTSSITALSVLAITAPSHSMTIDKRVTIQPIQVCDDVGNNCANPARELFSAATNKIWAQAGIEVDFLDFRVLNDSFYLETDIVDELDSLWDDSGNQANDDLSIVSMWFVDSIVDSSDPGGEIFGIARSPFDDPDPNFLFNRVAIADGTFSFDNGGSTPGRFDTIAHEIGHTLGLDHTTFGAGGSENLMTTGDDRAVGQGLGDITPDGANVDQLNTAQINQARSVTRTVLDIEPQAVPVPEPEPLAMLGAGAAIAFGTTVKRKLAQGKKRKAN